MGADNQEEELIGADGTTDSCVDVFVDSTLT